MRRDWPKALVDILWIALTSVTMGTFVAIPHFLDYGPLLVFDVGAAVIGIGLVAGVVLGFLLAEDEIQYIVLKGFLACLGAIAVIAITVYAPVFAGVVSNLSDLGSSQPARLASLFVALFLVPIHLVGNVIGAALAEMLFPGRFLRTDA